MENYDSDRCISSGNNKGNDNLLLSICVPFYNRYDNLEKIINSVIKAKSREFELLIVDNCSERGIRDAIDFNDDRIKIIRRDIAVSGEENGIFTVVYANGKYSMFLLDKDYIEGERIDTFLDVLNENENVIAGYCKINANESDKSYKIVSKNPILKF